MNERAPVIDLRAYGRRFRAECVPACKHAQQAIAAGDQRNRAVPALDGLRYVCANDVEVQAARRRRIRNGDGGSGTAHDLHLLHFR
jgi:hypothetical protein